MEQLNRRSLIAGASLIGAGVVASLGRNASAGGRDPSAGMIRGGAESEPRTPINQTNTPGDSTTVFRITQPGSYYLTANITGGAGRSGIEIAADEVTIDLMGFSVVGLGGSVCGIRSVAPLQSAIIRNGIVTRWGQRGIDMAFNGLGVGGLIENIIASYNAQQGIRANQFAAIRGCTAISNGSVGIMLVDGGTIDSSLATGNISHGISAGNGVIVRQCVARENLGTGITVGNNVNVLDSTAWSNSGSGIVAGYACTVQRCIANSNFLDGIRVSGDSIVRENCCSVNGVVNSGAGIRVVNSDCRVEANSSNSNPVGYSIDGHGNLFIRNSASGNATNFILNSYNQYGAILNQTTGLTAAVIGNSAAGTLNSSDPWANIAF
ncbi:MAG: right-handed parallel beta-helix repeat-containing protein [Pyrinomonadaceae bacterium]|nr:right-handed parallel beta-helix repeat-containing protein [Phycisphaerales bacterium]